MKNLFLTLSIFMLLLSTQLSPLSAQLRDGSIYNWAMVDGDPGRQLNFAVDLYPPLEIANRYDVGGFTSELSYYEGVLYVGLQGEPNIIKAFDSETEELLWTFEIPESGGSVGFTPTIQDSVILLGGQHGNGLYALNRLTGKQIWFKPYKSLYNRHPIIKGNRIYILVDSMYCLNLLDGTRIWANALSNDDNISPMLDEENIYYLERDTLAAADPLSGTIKWKAKLKARSYASLTGNDSLVFVGYQENIYAIRKSDGSQKWETKVGDNQWLSNHIAVGDQQLIFKTYIPPNDSFFIKAIDPKTAELLWSRYLPKNPYHSPLIVHDKVFDLNREKVDLYMYDRATGDSVYTIKLLYMRLTGCPIIIGGNRLYAGGVGQVMALASSTTGVIDYLNDQAKFTLYPNPANSQINILANLPHSGKYSLIISNIMGQRVKNVDLGLKNFGKHGLNINIQDLVEGMYFVALHSDTKIIGIERLIIE